MSRPSITPLHVARPFELHELFFSTTDTKGIIRSGNQVFTRVSAYSNDELIGSPHNIIRHPDMPRAVFQLLWDWIPTGRPIAAYVKNLAQDGCYYWVLATVVAIEGGYLSVRLKPSAGLLPVVEEAYAELLRIERRVAAEGGTPKEEIAASSAALGPMLRDLGFADYEAFMRHILPAELSSRRTLLAGRARQANRSRSVEMQQARDASAALTEFLYQQFDNRDQYTGLIDAFVSRAESIRGVSDDVMLSSLNAQVAAARLQAGGAPLGVVADLMRVRANAAADAVRQVSSGVEMVRDVQLSLGFDLALAVVQSEMVTQFIDELIAQGTTSGEAIDPTTLLNIDALVTRLRDGIGPMLETLGVLDSSFDRMAGAVSRLAAELRQLDALQVSGRVESAHLDDAYGFRVLFLETRDRIAAATSEVRYLESGRHALDQSRQNRQSDGATRSLDRIARWAEVIRAA